MLPSENASGNYVKVVQRIPVKIVFEPNQELVGTAPARHVRRSHCLLSNDNDAGTYDRAGVRQRRVPRSRASSPSGSAGACSIAKSSTKSCGWRASKETPSERATNGSTRLFHAASKAVAGRIRNGDDGSSARPVSIRESNDALRAHCDRDRRRNREIA